MPTSSSEATRPRSRIDPLGRFRDPAEDLEQGRFAGAVAADEPDDLAPLDFERDVAQGPERRGLRPRVLRAHPDEPFRGVVSIRQYVSKSECVVSDAPVVDPTRGIEAVMLADVLGNDDWTIHGV